jgi:hypothetical protein
VNQNAQRPPQQNRNPGKPGQRNPVTAPLTPKGLAQETRRITSLKYNPLQRKEAAEHRASNQRVKQVGNWWDSYLNTVSQGRDETAAAYAKANQETQGLLGQTSALDTANTGRLQTEAAQSAALRGAEPSTEAAGREAAAQAQRNYLGASAGARTAEQGANTFAYLTNQKRIGAGQKIASRKEEQRRGRTIGEDQKATIAERGEYAGKTRGELKEKERNYLIQRAATGLEKQKGRLEASEAEQKAHENAEENRRKNEAQRNENTKTQRETKGGALTPSERHSQKRAWNNAKSSARTLFESRKWPGGWPELTRAVEKQSEVSPALARRAVKRLRQHEEAHGGPSGGTVAEHFHHSQY